MLPIYLIITVFFAFNYTMDGITKEQMNGRPSTTIMILLGFLGNCVLWPARLARSIWKAWHEVGMIIKIKLMRSKK